MVVPSLSRFLAKSCDYLPKLLIFLRMGELLPPKRQIFKPISHPLSPEFVTNSLLGLSRPVGRVPESGFDAFLHHSLGAAISPCGEEANKLFGKYAVFPDEMGVCEDIFHCVRWRKYSKNNTIFLTILVSQQELIFVRFGRKILVPFSSQKVPFPRP
jgi:hypothetical protein